MIDRMKLKTRIALLVIAALLGLVSLVVFSAVETRRDMLNGRKEVIQSVLEGFTRPWRPIRRRKWLVR